MSQKTKTKAIGYCRCSLLEQATGGVTLEAQQEAIGSYAGLRGLELVDIVIDAGVSGGKPLASRPGGRLVLQAVKKKNVRAVIGLKLDRLFRSCSDALSVTEEWERSQVALHLIDLGGTAIDSTSPSGKFLMTILGAAAELERNMIADRTRTALQHKARKGQRIGDIPLGYRLAHDGVHLEEDPQEFEAVELIRRLKREGMSIRKITARLNEEGVPSRGKRWYPKSVWRVLQRPESVPDSPNGMASGAA